MNAAQPSTPAHAPRSVPPAGARGQACRRRHGHGSCLHGRFRPRRLGAPALATLLVLGVTTGRASAQSTPVLIDRAFTVGSTASIAVAAGDLVALVESRFVPDRLFEERGAPRRTANIAYRSARLLFFDLPQEQFLLVANHEIAGHGGRLRELFDGAISYRLDAPAPYGNGGGITFYEPGRDATVHELQAVSIGGMEANAVGAALITRRAFAERRLGPRAALRYLTFELDILDYVLNTGDEPERPGHDVSDFVVLYNLSGSFADADPLAPRTLRREVWWSLANPMVASAAIAIGRYVATGRESSAVLTLPVGGVDLLPLVRYRFAPYGTEWSAGAHVGRGEYAAEVGLRVGRAPSTRPWGLFVSLDGWRGAGWQLGLAADLWRQPPLALGPSRDFGVSAVGDDLVLGTQLRARVESPAVRLWRVPLPLALVVDAGAKSEGFVPGERLGGGLVLRAGLGLPLGRH